MSDRALDRTTRPGVWYAVPAMVFFGLFALVPLVFVLVLSFTHWNGLGDPQAAGWANWERLAADPTVLDSLRITVVLGVVCWLVQTPLSLLLGVWAAGHQRNRAVLSAVFFLPLLLSGAAVAIVWRSLLDPNFGLASVLGPLVGVPDGNLLGSGTSALLVIVVIVAWQFVPFHTLLYQAAARRIPRQLYEAARIDGANRLHQFRHITLPQLRNTIITSSLLMVVGSLTYFETILIVTDGGPGRATEVLPYRMYEAGFRSYEMGYGAAIASALVLIGTLLSLIMVRFSGFSKMRSTLEGL
ncbi:xylobiose transport system permease protein [Actinoalloteichus hoggarensis]|uniref:L-arabinose transport system permease protein AraP n=1 Tax=Actinoalloteichus hoggarensis TaxID=1470176 RepID=A0A221W5L5_9PSEU|nr:sugar ABC transporter permease [Actinoalloteichus hoggarensis]ASO21003.1 L-arabinose transport system permease protein AraP [Actinoalloteichus hoggarensis]MBB5920934.1 xylobiose transport system permease protein [Actinoalloteichus hoggarensis]